MKEVYLMVVNLGYIDGLLSVVCRGCTRIGVFAFIMKDVMIFTMLSWLLVVLKSAGNIWQIVHFVREY